MTLRTPAGRRRARARWRRFVSDLNLSFVLSVALHLAIFLLLGSAGAKPIKRERRKLTEVSYVEERYHLAERYGDAVAEKVSFAPEKLGLPSLEPSADPSLEGSIFGTGEAKGLPPQPDLRNVPAALPADQAGPNPFAAPAPAARLHRGNGLALPTVREEEVLLAAGLADKTTPYTPDGGQVNLKGQVLVGRKSRLTDEALFAVEQGTGPALAGSGLTLAVPAGGIAGGRADLVGGTLPEGKQDYRGELPKGTLVAHDGSKERLTALASLQVVGPGGDGDPGGGGLAGVGPIEPSRGTGLISRGGSDAVSRGGGLTPRAQSGARTAEAIAKSIAPERSGTGAAPAPADAAAGDAAAGGARGGKAEKAVSMTLSGPILEREVLASRAPDYPPLAKQKGWQGTVSVYFTVLPDGSIKKVFVEQASPHQVLDEAAKACLANWRFSPLPAGATGEQWGVLTIIYRLR